MRPVDTLVRSTPLLDRPTLVAIDGVDGSGKTTFAAQLAARYSEVGRRAHVVHMDDFLNPRATRYRLGRNSPEGFFWDTYNLPAFTSSVLEPLRRSGPTQIVCRAFDYRTDQPVHEEPTAVAVADVVLVEGSPQVRRGPAHLPRCLQPRPESDAPPSQFLNARTCRDPRSRPGHVG